VWKSSENWQLYYRLRQSYADFRLLHEAPGHLFLDYEEPDFISFLQLVLQNGWDAHLLPNLVLHSLNSITPRAAGPPASQGIGASRHA